ncbi:hypothetical protein ACH3XW_27165 [Acanthocheilonema viteae]
MEIVKTIPTETIVLTVCTAEGKKQTKNEIKEKSYRDKILEIVEKVVERNDNPCATYVIEEFSDKATFSRLLSEAEVICELEKIFHDVKSAVNISIANAIESFRRIPWASQITNILFVPDETMYRNQKMFRDDMKSAKDLLKRMATENLISAPRIIIGNSMCFRDIDRSVSVYSSDMSVNELTNAILRALKAKEFTMSEGLFTSITSINEDEMALSNTSKTHSTRPWIKSTAQEKQMSTLDIENIDSTTTSFDLPMTVTGSAECAPPKTFVSYSTAESEVVNSTSTISHTDSQFQNQNQKVQTSFYHIKVLKKN